MFNFPDNRIDSLKLRQDLDNLCSFGGRFAGSASESAAREFLTHRLAEATGTPVKIHKIPYNGWSRESWHLQRLTPHPLTLHAHPLVRSPSTPANGVEAEVIDLGRGTLEDFAAHKQEIAGRFVLVRHEYMFSTTHVHRRVKYGWALEHGAAGFLIGCHLPGELVVTGSSGGEGIPALGITNEGIQALARTGTGYPRVNATVKTRTQQTTAQNLMAELPGQTDEWVIVCAHYDGHDLAQSAIDNATGAAAALSIAKAFASLGKPLRRGLRIVLFTIEEWGLLGSRAYVDEMRETERRKIALVINLDSLVGGSKLTALTSGFEDLNRFVASVDPNIETYLPMMANSDHYNFASHGIPSLRLVSGFNQPDSDLRYLLTSGDRLARIHSQELANATRVAAAMTFAACTQATPIAPHKPE